MRGYSIGGGNGGRKPLKWKPELKMKKVIAQQTQTLNQRPKGEEPAPDEDNLDGHPAGKYCRYLITQGGRFGVVLYG